MGVPGVDPRMIKGDDPCAGITGCGEIEHIADAVGIAMPTLGQHRRADRLGEFLGSIDHGFMGGERAADEVREFGEVGGEQRRAREQQRAHGFDRIRRDQRSARGGDHHRIEHDGRFDPCQRLGHGGDHGGIMQHPDLDRIHADIVDARGDLLRHHLRRERDDPLDANGILRRDRGDRRHGIAAEHGDGLDIGLNASATG